MSLCLDDGDRARVIRSVLLAASVESSTLYRRKIFIVFVFVIKGGIVFPFTTGYCCGKVFIKDNYFNSLSLKHP